MWGMGGLMVLSKLLLALLLYPGLFTVCVRYVDDEGYLRGREITFNQHGRDMALKKLPYSEDGICTEGLQGPTQRVVVCLAMSSRCHHDRTTNVWADQVEQYFDRYPGSYRGKCDSEPPDECGKHIARVIEGSYSWLYRR